MKDRRVLGILLLLFVGLLSLSCTVCGITVWWVANRGPQLQEVSPTAPVAVKVPVKGEGELALFGNEPVGLDPARAQDASSAVYLVEIFGGLVTLDRNLEVAPDLAERWEMSPDGRTYTFYLRRDAKFQDGRPVTAADVQYSLERACSPELNSHTAPLYLSDVEGVVAVMEGKAKEISGLRVLDDYRLALTIDAPKSYFLAKLTYPVAFVVDRNNVAEGADWSKHPNGTGPFSLESWDSEQVVLKRNEHYYGGVPALRRVTFILSGGSPMTMYENDQLDIVQVGLDDIERVLDPSNPLNRELTVVPSLDVQYLGMNVQVPPFDDIKVRQAFAHAIDRQRLANVVLKKTLVAAEGILPPGLPGYQEDLRGLEFNPDLALQLLRESKYKDAADLPEVVLHISGEAGLLPSPIEAVVAMLRTNLGVDVKVQQTPWEDFLGDLNEQRYAFFFSGWIADYPDPQNFLDMLFHSQSPENHMSYRNPEADRLLEQARVEPDAEARLRLYQQVEALLVQDAVWVPLWHGRDYMLTKPYVKGAVYSAAVRPWLKDVYLEQ